MPLDSIHARVNAPGMSILVGSVDRSGHPACCRGVGLVTDDGLGSATVFVPLATSRDVVANAAASKRLAIVASHVIDHIGYQLKGRVRALRLATEAEGAVIRRHIGAFADEIIGIGMAPRLARSITQSPAFAIEIDVEELYDQTPGPKAGVSVR
jgi:hypothetical protein